MYVVPVAVLPILVVALVVAVARIIIVVVTAVVVVVLFAFSVAGRLLFAVPGTVSLPTVRTTAVVLFATAFAIFVVLLIGGMVFLVGR